MHISDEDFCLMVEGKFGWSVGQQAADLLIGGESLEEQNEYALEEILILAKKYKPDLAEEITEYLAKIGVAA